MISEWPIMLVSVAAATFAILATRRILRGPAYQVGVIRVQTAPQDDNIERRESCQGFGGTDDLLPDLPRRADIAQFLWELRPVEHMGAKWRSVILKTTTEEQPELYPLWHSTPHRVRIGETARSLRQLRDIGEFRKQNQATVQQLEDRVDELEKRIFELEESRKNPRRAVEHYELAFDASQTKYRPSN